MARLKIKILGAKRLRRLLRRAAAKFEPEMAKNLRRAGEILISEAQKQFKGSRTRARFKIMGGRRVARSTPRAVTAPPNKLGIFTGQYRKSISQDVRRRGRRRWETEVGPVGIKYARTHEFGRGRIPKRPVLTPALKKSTPKFVGVLEGTFGVIE